MDITCSNEIFQAMEDMELKLEEVQMFCDEQSAKREAVELRFIQQEAQYMNSTHELTQQILALKRGIVSDLKNQLKESSSPPSWLSWNFDKDDIIEDLLKQKDALLIDGMQKDTLIESLSSRLMTAETSITLLTGERTQLALEVDELAMRVEQYECALEFGKVPSNKEEYHSSSNGLVRAANFSNICALDESLDFKMEADKLYVASGNGFSSNQNSCLSLNRSTPRYTSNESLFSSDPNLQKTDHSKSCANETNPWSFASRKRASDVCNQPTFADDFSQLTISSPKFLTDHMWEFTPDSVLNVSTGEILMGKDATVRTRSSSISNSLNGKETLEIPTDIELSSSLPSGTSFNMKCEVEVASNVSSTDEQPTLLSKFPNFSRDLNFAVNNNPTDNLKETDCNVSLENSVESGIFCCDKSESDMRSSTSSLCRRNSDCVAELMKESKFTRKQSDPRHGRLRRKPENLIRYKEWLNGGKKGDPPVQISKC